MATPSASRVGSARPRGQCRPGRQGAEGRPRLQRPPAAGRLRAAAGRGRGRPAPSYHRHQPCAAQRMRRSVKCHGQPAFPRSATACPVLRGRGLRRGRPEPQSEARGGLGAQPVPVPPDDASGRRNGCGGGVEKVVCVMSPEPLAWACSWC